MGTWLFVSNPIRSSYVKLMLLVVATSDCKTLFDAALCHARCLQFHAIDFLHNVNGPAEKTTTSGTIRGCVHQALPNHQALLKATHGSAFSQLAWRHAASLVVRYSLGQQIEETSMLRTAFRRMRSLQEKQKKERTLPAHQQTTITGTRI